MNPAIYLMLIMLLFLIFGQKQKKKQWITQFLKLKYRKDHKTMEEAAKKFIGQECYIHLLSGELTGTIREVTDHALLVETKSEKQLVNLDFVIRIREYPRNKNGKKKAIIFD